MMQNFEQIRAEVSTRHNLTANDPYLICIELSLDHGRRRQSLFLTELEGDDGRKYLRFSSAIAPVTGIDARRALVFNWEQRVGYLALSELDSVPYLHLCENRPYDGLTGAEIDRLVIEVGGLSDRLEQVLSGGGDIL
jgi:hypothetical protein